MTLHSELTRPFTMEAAVVKTDGNDDADDDDNF